MRKFFIGAVAAVLAVALSCGGGGGPSEVLKAMQKVYSSENFDDANKYYTKATVALIHEMNKLNPKSSREHPWPTRNSFRARSGT